VETAKAIVIGAGVAGLACARALGEGVVVLDKARGVGGRCATRRIEGQALDHGVTFFHGNDPDFLAALAGVEGLRHDGWPRRIVGGGTPCHPNVFAEDQTRVAFADGASAFPKHLANGLDVRLQTTVTRVTPDADGLTLERAEAPPIHTKRLVLALPIEQAIALSDPSWAPGLKPLLQFFRSRACLTWLAGYDADIPDPGFDQFYPGGGVIQLISQESTKRPGALRTFVVQATPAWSRMQLEAPPEVWQPQLADATAAALGAWARTPRWSQTHRWRYARLDAGFGLSGPHLSRVGDARVGWCGEVFDPTGGVQGAWRSGVRLARHLLAD
jgi:renalase